VDRKDFWENVYESKSLEEVGWYQPKPLHSLDLIQSLDLETDDAIIDIGGGDSLLSDNLMELGYLDISVLDISLEAINKAKMRHGSTSKIQWIQSDITDFTPKKKYKLWHDRAAFHFLTDPTDQVKYIETCENSLESGSYLIIGTFSKTGPEKCSGIPIVQHSIEDLKVKFSKSFKYLKGLNVDHITPSGNKQNFTFCIFKKI